MRYCRGLSFTHDPDYKYIKDLFEGCMERHGYDVKQADFIWNKNRLFLEREALKQQMARVIKPKQTKDKERLFDGNARNKDADGDQGAARD